MIMASASASPSPRSPEISEKSKKYDRQLRLWGDHGQARLEKSFICVINANATGTEIVKSLVLPGIGGFTIVDGNKVTEEDIGNNFFLDSDCLGKSRADCTTRYLLELNPDVTGESIVENPESLVRDNPTFFNRFSVVVGSQLSERVLLSLSKLLWENSIPFVYVHSIGFIGWIRLQLNEHTVIESHPDNVKEDLRLDAPFPELISHMDSIKISGREYAIKMPWLVLVYKAIQSYMNGEGNTVNGNDGMETAETHPCHMMSKQKLVFKDYLKQFQYTIRCFMTDLRALDLNDDDDSYKESMRSINSALTRTVISLEVREILQDPKIAKPENSKFWVMAGALQDFVDSNNGHLPVRGVLPDMVADSEKYISLQNVYRERANKDADEILAKSQQHSQGVNVMEQEARLFSKESNYLRVQRGYPLFHELRCSPSEVLQELAQNTEDSDQGMIFYILLRGMLKFHTEYNTYPGLLDNDVEPDIHRFKSIMTKMLNEWSSACSVKDDFIHEICRYGASEIPSIAAFVGGCAAQEVIKLVTKQYLPLDNTLIYNAMSSTTSSFKINSTLNT